MGCPWGHFATANSLLRSKRREKLTTDDSRPKLLAKMGVAQMCFNRELGCVILCFDGKQSSLDI
jgi:hypothetical protein